MARVYDFAEKLAWSRGCREEDDLETIKKLIPGCVAVRKTSEQEDRGGIDYIATLRRGAEIKIDAKGRKAGCATFWGYGEPEFAPEIWSVVPENGGGGTAGWTLCEKKEVDYIYCKFDPSDTDLVYLLPFQLYRAAFRKHLKEWCDTYKTETQDSGGWRSRCVFVPASVVIAAIVEQMQHNPVRGAN